MLRTSVLIIIQNLIIGIEVQHVEYHLCLMLQRTRLD